MSKWEGNYIECIRYANNHSPIWIGDYVHVKRYNRKGTYLVIGTNYIKGVIKLQAYREGHSKYEIFYEWIDKVKLGGGLYNYYKTKSSTPNSFMSKTLTKTWKKYWKK
jgi:hypothetical protein